MLRTGLGNSGSGAQGKVAFDLIKTALLCWKGMKSVCHRRELYVQISLGLTVGKFGARGVDFTQIVVKFK